MSRINNLARTAISGFCIYTVLTVLSNMPAIGSTPQETAQAAKRPGTDGTLTITVGMTMMMDSPLPVSKISIANDLLAEAVPVTPTELVINGKAPGETSLIVWQKGGSRLIYDLVIRVSPAKLDAVRHQIARDFPDEDIDVTLDNDTAFVRGTVKDMFESDRIMAMVGTLGKVVNLMRVDIPAQEPQILLKVRFADVDRAASQDLGANLASSAFNQNTGITTGQFGSAGISGDGSFSLSEALNVLLFRKDLNLGVTIKALQSKNLLQMLAEPNVLAMNGKAASFLSGGEFPVPMTQGSASLGTVTVAFKPYGIQLDFLPVVTPRGTIRLQVTPSVSSLDFAHAVTLGGTTVPATSTRKISTEVELESGQSFVIAGLLDNETSETLSKIPGLSSIPILGALFKSRSTSKNNSELLVIVTPELVRPLAADKPLPALNYPQPFLPTNSGFEMRQPNMDKTGPMPVHPVQTSMPVEQLLLLQKQQPNAPQPVVPNGPPAAPPTLPNGTGGTPQAAAAGAGGGVVK